MEKWQLARDDGGDNCKYGPSYECPCPSETCWTFEPESRKCRLNPDCITMACNAKDIDVKFSEDLFGAVNGVRGVLPAPIRNETDGQYHINCPLGECGMAYHVTEDEM